MKIAIIEPHYDDCWLNVGGFMLSNPQHKYRVITISKDDNWGNNINNTKKLIKYIPHFESVELRYESLDVNIQKVKQQIEEIGTNSLDDLFAEVNSLSDVNECVDRIKKTIKGFGALFLPLGINHPMHIMIGGWEFDIPTLRYQEYPYAYYYEEGSNLMNLTKGMKKFNFDILKVINKKERIFREIYASEIFVLDLPECSKSLSELDKELFYSKDDKGEKIWARLV